MSKRYPGGLITKTPVVPTTAAAPGVWTLEQALQYIKVGTWPIFSPSDSDFEYVTMLLPGNGTNGAQNNTFLDSSTNNFTITRNGNTTQGTFSPYGSNWSNYFDGNGDYLTTATSASGFSFGTGDFTIEFWINSTQTTRCDPIGQNNSYTSSGWWGLITNLSSSGQLQWFENTDSRISATATNWNNGTWNHIAVTRSGNSVRMFVNGVQAGSTYTTSFTYGASNVGVIAGVLSDDKITGQLTGYMSNFRIVKGTALYTSTFTPSTTPLTAITNTSLLTCQSNRFIDNSSNNFAITRNGDVSVQRFSPFSPTASYAPATIGGSGYFDGSGDYLSLASNAAFALPGQYTFEMWYYPTGTKVADNYYFSVDASGGFSVGVDNTGRGICLTRVNQALEIVTGVLPVKNSWNHIAVVRNSSNTTSIYLNGSRIGNATIATSYNQGPVSVGAIINVYPIDTGYATQFRLVKGTAVYDPTLTTITVPTSPLTAITNTSLLLNMTNAGIIDNAMMNNLETVGNAQISTTQSKFGGGSMAFDGTGDYLLGQNTPNTWLGSGNFTIEGWIYYTSTSGKQVFCGRHIGGNFSYQFSKDPSGNILAEFSTSGSGLTASPTFTWGPSTGQWYHFAFCRSGANFRVFINGTQIGSTYNIGTDFLYNSTSPFVISYNLDASGQSINGYLDDLRITKGVARYTANFTPPTAAFPTR